MMTIVYLSERNICQCCCVQTLMFILKESVKCRNKYSPYKIVIILVLNIKKAVLPLLLTSTDFEFFHLLIIKPGNSKTSWLTPGWNLKCLEASHVLFWFKKKKKSNNVLLPKETSCLTVKFLWKWLLCVILQDLFQCYQSVFI